MAHQYREAWLSHAVEGLRDLFAEIDIELPETLRVSVGFGTGRGWKRVAGECWYADMAEDGAPQIFVAPTQQDPLRILDVLVHELCHAVLGHGHGHRGEFPKLARRMGLVKPWTSTTASPGLRERLEPLAESLGAYPHAGLSLDGLTAESPKKQSTRMLKVTCPEDEYTVRTTRKWLDAMGAPTCPCGTLMEEQ